MKKPPEERDPQMDKFSIWLKESTVQPGPDFLKRIRWRMQTESEPADQLLDQLLKMDASMRNPRMVNLVRQRLESDGKISGNRSLPWFSWLAPLAAAATLTLAFVSFQSRAPQASPAMAAQQTPAVQMVETPQDDFEITRIFALAANLHSSADMSQLQSVEDLASLFD